MRTGAEECWEDAEDNWCRMSQSDRLVVINPDGKRDLLKEFVEWTITQRNTKSAYWPLIRDIRNPDGSQAHPDAEWLVNFWLTATQREKWVAGEAQEIRENREEGIQAMGEDR